MSENTSNAAETSAANAKSAAKAEQAAAVIKTPKAHGPIDDAKAAKAGRLAVEAAAEAEQAGLNLVAEGPLNGYDHARAQLSTDPEAE